MTPKLAVSLEVGGDMIRERNLYIEVRRGDLRSPALEPLSDRVTSAHAPSDYLPGVCPYAEGRVWLHAASVDENIRQQSLAMTEKFISEAARRFPNLQIIVMHGAPHYYQDPPVRLAPGAIPGTPRPDLAGWEHLVKSVRRLACFSARLGLRLAVENSGINWGIVPSGTHPGGPRPELFSRFCASPEEWLQLPADVNEPNLSCCFDSSHATIYSQLGKTENDRRALLARFFDKPERIGHIHWNDSDIAGTRGRKDLHLPVGKGTLGKEFHTRIKGLAAKLPQPVNLEHFENRESLNQEIEYISALPASGHMEKCKTGVKS